MKKRCKYCNSENVKDIKYGLLIAQGDDDFVSGGCLVSDTYPKYYCVDCESRFGLNSSFYMLFEQGEIIALLSKFSDVDSYNLYDLRQSECNPNAKNSFNSRKEAAVYILNNPDATKDVWEEVNPDKEDMVVDVLNTFFDKIK